MRRVLKRRLAESRKRGDGTEIARVVYLMLKNRVLYAVVGAKEYEAKQHERELTRLKRQAAKLGYSLTLQQTAVAA